MSVPLVVAMKEGLLGTLTPLTWEACKLFSTRLADSPHLLDSQTQIENFKEGRRQPASRIASNGVRKSGEKGGREQEDHGHFAGSTDWFSKTA